MIFGAMGNVMVSSSYSSTREGAGVIVRTCGTALRWGENGPP